MGKAVVFQPLPLLGRDIGRRHSVFFDRLGNTIHVGLRRPEPPGGVQAASTAIWSMVSTGRPTNPRAVLKLSLDGVNRAMFAPGPGPVPRLLAMVA